MSFFFVEILRFIDRTVNREVVAFACPKSINVFHEQRFLRMAACLSFSFVIVLEKSPFAEGFISISLLI